MDGLFTMPGKVVRFLMTRTPHKSRKMKLLRTWQWRLRFEGLEPDDLLPISLPLDDLARHGIIGIAKQLPLPGFEKYVDDAATQIHHLITNKGEYWPDVILQITNKYKLDLDGSWKKVPLPGHSGSHTDWYHQWIHKRLQEIDAIAKGDRDLFLDMFNETVKKPVL